MQSFSEISEAPSLYVQGFNFVVSSTNALHLVMGAGQCRTFDNENDIIVSDVSTLIDSSQNGFNGLDTGSVEANKMYAIYAIGSSSNAEPSGFILSLNQNNLPYMPFNYDLIRRVGWVASNSDATALLDVKISGSGNVRTYEYVVLQNALSDGDATDFTQIALFNVVPSVSKLPISLIASFSNAGFTTGAFGSFVMSPDGVSTPVTMYSSTATLYNYSVQMLDGLDDSIGASIYYKVAAGDGTTPLLSLNVVGFTDYL